MSTDLSILDNGPNMTSGSDAPPGGQSLGEQHERSGDQAHKAAVSKRDAEMAKIFAKREQQVLEEIYGEDEAAIARAKEEAAEGRGESGRDSFSEVATEHSHRSEYATRRGEEPYEASETDPTPRRRSEAPQRATSAGDQVVDLDVGGQVIRVT
jgi:hypothetical protein